MGNQASSADFTPAGDKNLRDVVDAAAPRIKYTLEVLLDSDQDYQKVDHYPANDSLSFHPPKTSSPVNKTPREKTPEMTLENGDDNLSLLHSCCSDKPEVAESQASMQPNMETSLSQLMPHFDNLNESEGGTPEMHWPKGYHGASNIPFSTSADIDKFDEWQLQPSPGNIVDVTQNSFDLQLFEASAPKLEEFNQDQSHEGHQQQNIDPQAMYELTQLLKKLQADIDRLLKIFDK